jgi:hypothetical protein
MVNAVLRKLPETFEDIPLPSKEDIFLIISLFAIPYLIGSQ